MDISAVVLSILAVLLIVIFLKKKYNYKRTHFLHLVNQIPGPPAYPIFGNTWEFINVPSYNHLQIYEKRFKKYSPICRIWLGSKVEIDITDAEYAEVILSSTETLAKSPFYGFLAPWLGNGLLTLTGERYHTLRKLVTPVFHFNVLEEYIAIFAEQSCLLVHKMMLRLGEGSFNVYPLVARCSLDIICETALGVKINCQNDYNSEYTSAVHSVCDLVLERYNQPLLHYDFIFNCTDLGKRFNKCTKILHQFTDKVIRERNLLPNCELETDTKDNHGYEFSEVRKKNSDFLGLMIEAMKEGNKLTNKELREMCDGITFGGHDTTALTVTWALQLLGEHKDVQVKVYKEMERIFQGSDRPPQWRDLQEMKYLERVIKETLRLYPAAPAIGRQITKDTKIGKYLIPAGVSVWIQIYFLHRNPKYFPNPEEFNPDNFLPERVRDRHPYAFIPWSAGPRNCIGQKYALLEAKTLLSTIIRNFHVESVKKTKDVTPLFRITLSQHKGVPVTVTLRQNKI